LASVLPWLAPRHIHKDHLIAAALLVGVIWQLYFLKHFTFFLPKMTSGGE
jgi:hypothetical protein